MRKLFFLLLCFAAAAAAWGQEPARFALVIGNGNYSNFGTLRNAVKDANDMESALRGLGFSVEKVLDGTLSQMEDAALRLKTRLQGAGRNAYGFFYYAGHGVQAGGQNYLIPASASIPGEEFLRERTVSAQTVLDILNGARNALNIVVLDACRDFPAAWSRSLGRGLSVMHPPANSIIMYATAAGDIASDGEGENGLFTGHLLRYLKTPGLEVNEVFRLTMRDVRRESEDRQRPALYTDFAETAYLGSKPAPRVVTESVPEVKPAPRPAMQAAPEAKPSPRPTMQTAPEAKPAPRPTMQAAPRPVSITYTGKLPELRHSGTVFSVTWSRDGRYIASGSRDETIKLWDAATGREIRCFAEHSDSAISVAFSPDGRFLASGSDDETIKLWDVATGREIRTLSGHSGSVYSVAFSPDGRFLASGSGDKTIKLWDVATGREIRSLAEHSNIVCSVAFSPDGRYIASGSENGRLELWDAATGKELRSFAGHSSFVFSVAFSPDGKYIVSGSDDKTIKLWDVVTGREIRTFSGHSNAVFSVAFSPDGKYIVSGSIDKTIKLWDAATGREIRRFTGHSDMVLSVAFSPDGRYIVSGFGDNTVRIWDVATGAQK